MESDGISASGGESSFSASSDAADFTTWDDLLRQQNSIYKQSAKKNITLEAQVKKLQDELEVWKMGYNNKARENEELEAKVAQLESALMGGGKGSSPRGRRDELETKVINLERNLTAIHEENPLVICLIDGDGAVFSESFLTRGKEGGRAAAAALNDAIRAHIELHNTGVSNSNSRNAKDRKGFTNPAQGRITSPQIICTIYFNRAGLCKTLLAYNLCTAQNFLDFFIGFNQASPLFTLVDVGDGKEAADAKLRESLKLHTRLPQTRKVFFGGTHDNGYMPTLMSLGTEGHAHKLVILKGYAKMANEVETFLDDTDTEVISIPGLFLQKKLPPLYQQHKKTPSFSFNGAGTYAAGTSEAGSGGRVTPEGRVSPMKLASPSKSPQKPRRQKANGNGGNSGVATPLFERRPSSTVVPETREQILQSPTRQLDPSKRVTEQIPIPCNSFYLTPNKCKFDSSVCKFAYDYEFSESQLEEFRREVAATPCAILLKRGFCSSGPAKCLYSHQCPSGAECSKLQTNSCKFIHPVNATSTPSPVDDRDDDDAPTSPFFLLLSTYNSLFRG
ncbi:hypothetical protein FRB95_003290 [Tulasnella sp. JGI-2019a]|nr:hypothetical protein FRB95_003290 [Tulasnella sp. JGI-2019a]